MTIPDALQMALQHHRAGQLAEAEALYRQILAVQPNHAEALHMLGVVAHERGRNDLALEWIRRAIAIDPGNAGAYCDLGSVCRAMGQSEEAMICHRRAMELKPDFALAYYNLGLVLTESGRLDEAIAAYRQAVGLQPMFLEAHNNLGVALKERGQKAQAEASFRRALELKPDYAESHNNLGMLWVEVGRFDEAVAAYHRALQGRSNYAEAHNNLGIAHRNRGEIEEAATAYRRALQIRPDYAEAHNNLGEALAEGKRPEEAIAALGRAIQCKPEYPEAHNNLGKVLSTQGRPDEARAVLLRALAIRPDYAEAYVNLGAVLAEQGRIEEAIEALRQALTLKPESAAIRSTLIATYLLRGDEDVQTMMEERGRWNRQFGGPFKPSTQPHSNERNPERKVRVGYVSPDFQNHVVGWYTLPLFRSHDRKSFEIICYSGVAQPDRWTNEFHRNADQWRSTAGMADDALAAMIQEDGLDILVDLAQHTAGNRLPMFARRPAPVQVSFAGYPESAGVDAIEYRISDRWLEAEAAEIPGASSESGWQRDPGLRTPDSHLRPAEQVYLIDSFWCYDPCGVDVALNALPVMTSGSVTFGSLNSFCKVNDGVLRLWARVLNAVRGSRLILLSAFGSHRQRTVEFLEQLGIASNRVEFVEPRPRAAYLELYYRLDIVLDTFPYGGHTTSLDALWMGVPVVSLAGERPVSRAGLSQLSNLKLGELVAFSEDEYVKIASELAGDVPRLAGLRATLRSRMEGSVLMDAPHFARQIEAAYRAMWRRWCAR